MYDLRGKVAIVTGVGAERGIGRAIAVRLAEEGADVVVSDLADNARGNWGGLPAVVSEIESLGRRSLGVRANVTDSAQVASMVRQTLDRFGKIDILVNNAGAPAGPDRKLVVDVDEAAFDLVLRVNVKGTFLCSKAVARHMIDRGQGGKIINMSSVSGLKGLAQNAAYCASKWAIIGFTQSLAQELGPHGVRVNVLCPGLIETERVDTMAEMLRPAGVSAEAYRAEMIAKTKEINVLGVMGQPEDVARAAAFLASSESDYMTGQAITVCGGYHMH